MRFIFSTNNRKTLTEWILHGKKDRERGGLDVEVWVGRHL